MERTIHFCHEQIPFPFYSVLVSLRGERIQEEYFQGSTKDTIHRMFSITKSFSALAVCALAAEGKLFLQDPIIRYFSNYTPEHPHPWLAEMTIQDMLDMRTCFESTTYKKNLSENWVESFFVTAPDHRSGQIFKYDTSSAHTLAALVKRLTGLGILDYLRPIYLNAIGFSEQAFVITDPFGAEMGGSGMVALPSDLMVTAEFLMSLYQDTWKQKYGSLPHDSYDESFFDRYRKLVRQCMSFRSETLHEGKTLDECQGYGSQFWMMRNGVMMYGMGGQYAAFYPEEDLIIVTTADSQSFQGGTQIILDEMNRIDSVLQSEAGRQPSPVTFPDAPASGDAPSLSDTLSALSGEYRFETNSQGFISCSIRSDELVLLHKECAYRFPISENEPADIRDPRYHQKLFIRTSALRDGSLYQYLQIRDDYLGSIRILIHGDGEHITVYLRKIEESLYTEFNGFLEAVRTGD